MYYINVIWDNRDMVQLRLTDTPVLLEDEIRLFESKDSLNTPGNILEVFATVVRVEGLTEDQVVNELT